MGFQRGIAPLAAGGICEEVIHNNLIITGVNGGRQSKSEVIDILFFASTEKIKHGFAKGIALWRDARAEPLHVDRHINM
ncbi:MAG: hypothetical protein S4CHLAM20_02970 [Chlamydiia bacterium]|nr:hypothetical protein [Chlamydiia bacterium]